MRFIFKTDYNQDIRLAKHGGHVFWYSLLGLFLLVAPWVIEEYWLAQLTFVLIYAVVGLGLMLLAGFTGLFSLGHAAFLGVGAYTQAALVNAGVPFPIALACAGLLAAAVGVVVGLPALRVQYTLLNSLNRIPLMQNGTVDLGCGPTTNNLGRQKQVAFALTTYVSEVRMAVRRKRPRGPKACQAAGSMPLAGRWRPAPWPRCKSLRP